MGVCSILTLRAVSHPWHLPVQERLSLPGHLLCHHFSLAVATLLSVAQRFMAWSIPIRFSLVTQCERPGVVLLITMASYAARDCCLVDSMEHLPCWW